MDFEITGQFATLPEFHQAVDADPSVADCVRTTAPMPLAGVGVRAPGSTDDTPSPTTVFAPNLIRP